MSLARFEVLGLESDRALILSLARRLADETSTRPPVDAPPPQTFSSMGTLIGMPVSVLGLSYFVAAVALYSPWAWWASAKVIHLIRIAASVIGMCMVLWLLAAELVIIKKICLWCTGVHIITFILFVITLTTAPAILARFSNDPCDETLVDA